MHIQGEGYEVIYAQERDLITFRGKFRLRSHEYAAITQLLDEVAANGAEHITLDVRELRFLNSSGINTLSKFVLKVRKLDRSGILVQGSADMPWQKKSLRNLQRLKPDLVLELGE